MNCAFSFLTILILHFSKPSNSDYFKKFQDSSSKWDNMCKHIADMMINCDEIQGATFNVAIYIADTVSSRIIYDDFHENLLNYSNYKFSVNSYNQMIHKIDHTNNFFAILLLDDEFLNYEKYISSNIPKILKNKALKIFLILSLDYPSYSLLQIFNVLTKLKYYNVYAIKHYSSGIFKMYRTAIVGIDTSTLRFYLKEADDTKFLMVKDVLAKNVIPNIRILYYESYPMSYINNSIIIGADGNLIQEFSQKLQTPYRIMNENRSYPVLLEIYEYMEAKGDINLYTTVSTASKNIESIWLNEMNGFCVLAPRNIPVSAYENFTFPLDNASMMMALISTLMVILCWRFITNEMSMIEILFAVYDLIFNLGASGLERLTFRENILIYCFVFSSFILVSFYESIFLSFMLTDSSMRSAHNLEELNDSNTRFNLFYDDFIADLNNLPKIRKDLVLNYTNFTNGFILEVPNNFDANMAYFVSCEFADYFTHSPRNYRDGNKLFDKISLALHYKTYNVRKGYFYIEEFRKIVKILMESGIYEFWKQLEFNKLKSEHRSEPERSTIEFRDMGTPVVVLLMGCMIAVVVLLIEIVVHKRNSSNNDGKLVNEGKSSISKKKLNLDNWKMKYIYKKNLGKKSKLQDKLYTASEDCLKAKHDTIKCRESTGGGYLVIKKFGNVKKRMKTKHKIIQVKPHNDDHVDQ